MKQSDEFGPAGRELWDRVNETFSFSEPEVTQLRTACRTADRLEQLHRIIEADGPIVTTPKGEPRAHPALVEHRQQAIVLARLLAALRLPDEEPAEPVHSRSQGTNTRGRRTQGARGVYDFPRSAG